MKKILYFLFLFSTLTFHEKSYSMERDIQNFNKAIERFKLNDSTLDYIMTEYDLNSAFRIFTCVASSINILRLIKQKKFFNQQISVNDQLTVGLITAVNIIAMLPDVDCLRLQLTFKRFIANNCLTIPFAKFCEQTKDIEFNTAIALGILTLMQISNLHFAEIYNKISSKNLVDIKTKKINYKQIEKIICTICRDIPDPQKIINFCEFPEHIYCKDCLLGWINNQKNQEEHLKCLLCYKEIIDCEETKLIYSKPKLKEKMSRLKSSCRPFITMYFCIIAVIALEIYASYQRI